MLQVVREGSRQIRIAFGLGVVVLAAVVFLACGSGSANTGTTTTGGTSSSGAKHFKVGDQVKVGDTYVVTVNSVKTSNGDDFSKPKSGNTFLVVDISIKNVSSKEQDLSSILQFTLKDSTGQKYEETILSGATAPDGKLAAGDVVKGQIPYEVPTAQHSFTLAFEADIISSGQTIWDLKI
ncbi:MAG: DUF4352 domain-containing protein [Ktedonobacterales bacterium]